MQGDGQAVAIPERPEEGEAPLLEGARRRRVALDIGDQAEARERRGEPAPLAHLLEERRTGGEPLPGEHELALLPVQPPRTEQGVAVKRAASRCPREEGLQPP